MKWSRSMWGVVLAALCCVSTSGCATRVRLKVLEPAAVYVPSDIRTLAVIDRSRAGNAAQGIAAAVEGAFSGEALGVDAAGRVEAIHGLTGVLTESPRFRVVQVMSDSDLVDADLFGRELSWRAAKRVCAQVRCQGIVALEAFDSDSTLMENRRTREEVTEDGRTVKKTVYEVSRSTRVTTGWRVYDTRRMTVLDQVYDVAATDTWTEEGDTLEEARRKLPSQMETVQQIAYDMGEDYARRIAPSYVYVVRKLYTRGDPRFKQANNYVKAQTWDPAVRLWEEVAREQDPKLRGKANFNLALAAEVVGDLERALNLAQAALEDLNNRRCVEYVRILQDRLAAQELLRQQMAHPPPRRGSLEYRRQSPQQSPETTHQEPPSPRGR